MDFVGGSALSHARGGLEPIDSRARRQQIPITIKCNIIHFSDCFIITLISFSSDFPFSSFFQGISQCMSVYLSIPHCFTDTSSLQYKQRQKAKERRYLSAYLYQLQTHSKGFPRRPLSLLCYVSPTTILNHVSTIQRDGSPKEGRRTNLGSSARRQYRPCLGWCGWWDIVDGPNVRNSPSAWNFFLVDTE